MRLISLLLTLCTICLSDLVQNERLIHESLWSDPQPLDDETGEVWGIQSSTIVHPGQDFAIVMPDAVSRKRVKGQEYRFHMADGRRIIAFKDNEGDIDVVRIDQNNEPASLPTECQDGDEDKTNPCEPKTCVGDMWISMIIDCAEFFGVKCPGIWHPPKEGECCGTCLDADDNPVAPTDPTLPPETSSRPRDTDEGCEEGSENNDNPCSPLTCINGQWIQTLVIDCAEPMGMPCDGGRYQPPNEGDCCSICVPFADGMAEFSVTEAYASGLEIKYQLHNLEKGGSIYYTVTTAGGTCCDKDDSVCYGSYSQIDELEHTVRVECLLKTGPEYMLFVSTDSDGQGNNEWISEPEKFLVDNPCKDFVWPPKGVVICNEDSECGEDETCDDKGCIASICNCDPTTGKEGICTMDCRRQCVKKDDVSCTEGETRKVDPCTSEECQNGEWVQTDVEECPEAVGLPCPPSMMWAPPLPNECCGNCVNELPSEDACKDFQWPPKDVTLCSSSLDCDDGQECGGACVPSNCMCDPETGDKGGCTKDCRKQCVDTTSNFGGWDDWKDMDEEALGVWNTVSSQVFQNLDLSTVGLPTGYATQVVAGLNYKFHFDNGLVITVFKDLSQNTSVTDMFDPSDPEGDNCEDLVLVALGEDCDVEDPCSQCDGNNICSFVGEEVPFICMEPKTGTDSACQEGEEDDHWPCGHRECFDGKWFYPDLECPEQTGIPCDGTYVLLIPGNCCTSCVNDDVAGGWALNPLDASSLAVWQEVSDQSFEDTNLSALGVPVSVTTQVVAGMNYKFNFEDGTIVTVNKDLQQNLSVIGIEKGPVFDEDPSKRKPDHVPDTPDNDMGMGGQWSEVHLEDEALAVWDEVLDSNDDVGHDLASFGPPVKVSKQVVAGINWRFTFNGGQEVNVFQGLDSSLQINDVVEPNPVVCDSEAQVSCTLELQASGVNCAIGSCVEKPATTDSSTSVTTKTPEVPNTPAPAGGWTMDRDVDENTLGIWQTALGEQDNADQDLSVLGPPVRVAIQVVQGVNYKFTFADHTLVIVHQDLQMYYSIDDVKMAPDHPLLPKPDEDHPAHPGSDVPETTSKPVPEGDPTLVVQVDPTSPPGDDSATKPPMFGGWSEFRDMDDDGKQAWMEVSKQTVNGIDFSTVGLPVAYATQVTAGVNIKFKFGNGYIVVAHSAPGPQQDFSVSEIIAPSDQEAPKDNSTPAPSPSDDKPDNTMLPGGWTEAMPLDSDTLGVWNSVSGRQYQGHDMRAFGVPITVRTQIIAGVNYEFGFTDGTTITVSQDLDQNLRVLDVHASPKEVVVVPQNNDINMGGGYWSDKEPLTPDTISLWNSVRELQYNGNDLLALGTPITVSTQVVAGANYKFYFQDESSVTVYKDLQGNLSITDMTSASVSTKPNQTPDDGASNFGGWDDWKDMDEEALGVWNTVSSQVFQNLDLSTVGLPTGYATQVVAGLNYKFHFDNGLVITVFKDLSQNTSVTDMFDPNAPVCSDEVSTCPDGSTVKRLATQNCNFDKCPRTNDGGVACTEEAKLCPDGSVVGRNPANNCEFDPCPMGHHGDGVMACPPDELKCSDGSFVSRDPNNTCEFAVCPQEGTQGPLREPVAGGWSTNHYLDSNSMTIWNGVSSQVFEDFLLLNLGQPDAVAMQTVAGTNYRFVFDDSGDQVIVYKNPAGDLKVTDHIQGTALGSAQSPSQIEQEDKLRPKFWTMFSIVTVGAGIGVTFGLLILWLQGFKHRGSGLFMDKYYDIDLDHTNLYTDVIESSNDCTV